LLDLDGKLDTIRNDVDYKKEEEQKAAEDLEARKKKAVEDMKQRFAQGLLLKS